MARRYKSPPTPSPWCQALLDQLPEGEDDFRYTTWRVVFVDGRGRTHRSLVNGTWLAGAWEGGIHAPAAILEGPDPISASCEVCGHAPAWWEGGKDMVVCCYCRWQPGPPPADYVYPEGR